MKAHEASVLITGATGGIGRALAQAFARDGASLILLGRDAMKLAALGTELRALGSRVLTVEADIGAPGEAERVVRQVLQAAGRVDILVNCAGTQNFGFFAQESSEDTDALFRVNVLAPMALAHAVLPAMMRRRRGHIVNVGSIFGAIGFPCFASYSASKFALRGFSEALRRELVGTGVRVSYVAPRFTRTALNGSEATRMADALKMNQDAPEDVARRIVACIKREARESHFGWPEKLFVRVNACWPRLVDFALRRHPARMRPYAQPSLEPTENLR